MKIILFGAGGPIGVAIALETLRRGNAVTGVTLTGEVSGISDLRFRPIPGDPTDEATLVKLVAGHDVVASAVGTGSGEDPQVIVPAAHALLGGTRKAGLRRLVLVGGSGSLETDSGGRRMDRPEFPAADHPVALAEAEVLEFLRPVTDVNWTYVSPPAEFGPGERTGRFRLGKEQLLVGPDGSSRISLPDFAVAFVDELGRGGHVRQRITVGY
jgi:uncharacterized protein